MATDDQAEFTNRLQQLVPHGWFSNGLVPVRDALLTGIANIFAFVLSLLAHVRLQSRIATATGGFLDMIAWDFFGSNLVRQANQTDTSFRSRIQSAIFLERATRKAVITILTQVTGRVPTVFEPQRAVGTGAYNVGVVAYDIAGAYGSLNIPYQSFVTAFRPLAGSPQFGISDADIYAAIENVRMAGTIIWVRILN